MEERVVVVQMNAELSDSWETAWLLAGVESRQGTTEGRKLRSHHAAVTIANLFLCGYFDQLIHEDSGSHFLTLFLGLQAVFPVLFTMAYFLTSGKEVLLKTMCLPVSTSSRFLFIVASSVRRPLFVGLYLTTCFFFAVVFWHTRAVIVWAVLLYSFMLIDLVLIVAVLAVFHNRISFAGVGVTLLFVSFVLITSSILFHQDFLLGGFPLIQWVVRGVVAIRNGEESQAILCLDVMGGLMVLLGLIGMKVVRD